MALAPGVSWGAPEWDLRPGDEEFDLIAIRFDADGVEVIDQLVLQNEASAAGPPSLGWPLEADGELASVIKEFSGKKLPTTVTFGSGTHYTVLLRVRFDDLGVERSWGRVHVTGLEYGIAGDRYFRPADATSFVGVPSEGNVDGPADCGPEWADPPQIGSA